MCLIVFAWEAHPEYQLVVAANRDEFYARESEPLHWWPDRPILGGRDLELGGGWLTLAANGRFAAVTNIRDFSRREVGKRSRGEIPVSFCIGDETPAAFARSLAGDEFSGFNSVMTDLEEFWWANNYNGEPMQVEPGIHGVSNAALDTPWPKVVRAKADMAAALADGAEVGELFALLSDRTIASDDQLPADTHAPIELERAASSAFMVTDIYGTNAQTVLRIRRDGRWDIEERRFLGQSETGRVSFSGRFST